MDRTTAEKAKLQREFEAKLKLAEEKAAQNSESESSRLEAVRANATEEKRALQEEMDAAVKAAQDDASKCAADLAAQQAAFESQTASLESSLADHKTGSSEKFEALKVEVDRTVRECEANASKAAWEWSV